MNSVVGFAGGFFVGIAFVIFRDQANKSVRDPGELSRQINVPDLGAIPEARQRFLQMSPYPFKPLSVLGDEGLHRSQAQPCLELITWNRKPSFIADNVSGDIAVDSFFSSNRGSAPSIGYVESQSG